MPRIYRASSASRKGRAGYEATYVADLLLEKPAQSLGFIVVKIPQGVTTEPHYHSQLDEAFIALTPLTVIVNGTEYSLEQDDILVAAPGEKHSFSSPGQKPGKLLAIKIPNIKDDKLM
jgi:quercetin dioxygenase-like cupin family protein